MFSIKEQWSECIVICITHLQNSLSFWRRCANRGVAVVLVDVTNTCCFLNYVMTSSTAVLSSVIVDESQRLPHVTVPRRSWRHIRRQSTWKGSKLYNHAQTFYAKTVCSKTCTTCTRFICHSSRTCLNDVVTSSAAVLSSLYWRVATPATRPRC